MGYGSDADVMFVHEPRAGAPTRRRPQAEAALAVANGAASGCSAAAGPDPPLAVDADLRPEGRQRAAGAHAGVVRGLLRTAGRSVWEARRCCGRAPVAGDPGLGERFVDAHRPAALARGRARPTAQVREIRRIKARVEAERLPARRRPARRTLKLGRGGLADVEWTVQLLQLQHAATHRALRTTRTLEALGAAAEAGLIDPRDADILCEAWRMASRIRNGMMVVRGRPSDSLSADVRELAGLARYMGYSPGSTGTLLEGYLRATRRSRATVERVFYS